MAYNKQYNTRNSGRYNTPGQFVPEELVPGAGLRARSVAATAPPTSASAPQPQYQTVGQRKPMQNQNHNQNLNQNLQTVPIQNIDIDMKPVDVLNNSGAGAGAGDATRPHWMKPKLPGVKKVTNKERRRRQNESLRKLLTPKNALMVLHEMLPNDQLTNQFRVEPAGQFNQYYNSKQGGHSFCADLTINGNSYKGYGENKLSARNVAAEQAIRDIIIQKMNKVLGNSEEMETEGDDDAALPMIQLASYALHKLFSEWEYDGHKVPQLKPSSSTVSISDTASETEGAKSKVAKKKELPANAAAMHPCMLLTYMRPHLEYRELAVDGDRPQNILFTLGVDVDGSTYIGKAPNKKEARKQAAKSACQDIFGVQFNEKPTDNAPQGAA
ncbi:double-stranded RNA-specific editase B2-like isoform X2 [Pectinophora gossypiella]|uniref:double-stranded RNA-specific editase B2-like isoform X2 n=1 Tax=Pectinophora gossypiella TaxID=13191 RepID=UPI00214EA53C|nr:double-stranded RNA-specific editase B2-like isoform X2 [Pectinophora gossypiella]